MTTNLDWEENGYKIYDCEMSKKLYKCDFLYQKKIVDKRGIRYFINVYVYDHSQYFSSGKVGFSYQPEVQFSSDPIINVSILNDNIHKIEKTFNNIWKNLKKPYYEIY